MMFDKLVNQIHIAGGPRMERKPLITSTPWQLLLEGWSTAFSNDFSWECLNLFPFQPASPFHTLIGKQPQTVFQQYHRFLEELLKSNQLHHMQLRHPVMSLAVAHSKFEEA